MARPGVVVTEAPLPRVVANPNTSAAYGGFLGTALRGPAQPVLVRSWSEFVAQFGGYGTGVTLPDAMHQFFSNGGGAAFVARVIASDATAATATTTDTRLTFDAISPGVWGNGITVDVSDSGNDTFQITVREQYRGVAVTRERHRSLSMDQNSPRYVESIVNSPTIGSNLIRVFDIDKDDTALADFGSTTLGTGGDGTAPTVADYALLLDEFDQYPFQFVFNAPGIADASSLVTKVQARGDSIILVDTEENQTPDMNGATLPTGGFAAVYYPWIYISDPSPDSIRGAIKKVPPSASVAGMIMRTDASDGIFKAPAGVQAALAGAVASEQRFTNTELDTLAGQNINVIRPVPGTGITLMGARTRSFGSTDQYISVRRTINYVKIRAVQVSGFALFEPNTPILWDQLRVANGAFLSELWQVGGLAGQEFSQAFYVKCDEENNTPATISNGEVHVEIGIAPVFPAEFIVIQVGQFEADASVVVTEEV